MEAALAAADAFRIDDASCAVTQFWTIIHEPGFAWTHTYICISTSIFISISMFINLSSIYLFICI